MTRRLPFAAAFLALIVTVAPSVLFAHDAVKSIVIMKPGQPRAGEACSFELSVLAPPGLPILDQIQGVRITASMSGHNMTPVEASLTQTTGPGAYAGSMALTMGGPWELTLHIKVSNEEMWGVFPVQAVRADQTGDPVGMRYVVEMRDPVRANIFSPWVVVGWTVGLIVFCEGVAIVLTLRRRRASAATVGQKALPPRATRAVSN